MMHLYVGDGKGKTTAAFGLALRALGWDKRVAAIQFLKGNKSGEIEALKKFDRFALFSQETPHNFYFLLSDDEKAALRCEVASETVKALELVSQGEYDLVVLDEIIDAVNLKLISVEDCLAIAAAAARSNTEVVMTGRNPDPAIERYADYYTLFAMQKHPYTSGVAARKAIEY
ncbi:cob(I)yrinic acid a,c-diamide adenosyltransferase [Feifania hominis]|uniref:Cob(I)yrinic acid a,c-diamide adenosyltransferase n=1 Tax=Feifania hominis TaxID=2763660 RepID=A0A926DBN8_9FIRM|nr:cob(I)yrinic acid a,c-diamide adenosyltransferase [Feifania hominis]MBC8535583.1 cob(I)yrinic acid a,c-diamide adenosyltransferase [Feifania hominis]